MSDLPAQYLLDSFHVEYDVTIGGPIELHHPCGFFLQLPSDESWPSLADLIRAAAIHLAGCSSTNPLH